MSLIKKGEIPPFFQSNPDAMNTFKKFWINNLNDLSVKKCVNMFMTIWSQHRLRIWVSTFLMTATLMLPSRPGVVEDSEPNNSKENFLLTYGLTKISICAIAR